MAQETRQFPHGLEVNIVRKEDILKTIDENIIDKNVAYELINTLSFDIAKNITNGKWTGIPYIGNIRPNMLKKIRDANKDIIADAKEVLTKEDYVVFKQQLNRFTAEQIKAERISRYKASMFASKNKWLYKQFAKHSEEYAICKCYFLSCCNTTSPYYMYLYGKS